MIQDSRLIIMHYYGKYIMDVTIKQGRKKTNYTHEWEKVEKCVVVMIAHAFEDE